MILLRKIELILTATNFTKQYHTVTHTAHTVLYTAHTVNPTVIDSNRSL